MSKVRALILFVIFLLFGAGIFMRLFSLQIKNFNTYQLRAASQQVRNKEFRRGNIFAQDKDGNFFLVGTIKKFTRLYAIPSHIPSGREKGIAHALWMKLGVSEEEIMEDLLKKNDPYVPLKDALSNEEKESIKELINAFPEGLKLEEYKDRFYPYANLASHALGFIGFNGNERTGLYGLEKYYNKELERGDVDIFLTIDLFLQQQAQKTLEELIERFNSPAGSIIIMRPHDGAILAMASKPDFNPNIYSQTENISDFLNPAIQKVFEPGSIVKPVTMASGIETGNITPNTTFVDKGFVKKGSYIIKNAGEKSYGKRTMTEVLELSINTGAIFVEEKVGQKDFLSTLERFGFGEKTGVDLPGELPGDITNLDSKRPINFATASFGQGISTTPLQIITALNSIANGGKLVKPYIAKAMKYSDGSLVETKPYVKRLAIRKETAAKLTAMMAEVVQKGYSKKAQVPGYAIAGKTGTAQISNPRGGYLEIMTIHSFIGFAPAFDPAFIVLIKLDQPLGIRFASDSIAPYFSQLAQYILQYYTILPEKTVGEQKSR